jgi:nitroreductase
MDKNKYINYDAIALENDQAIDQSKAFYELMNKRRSVRFFSDKNVPKEIINNVIKSAGTAPSGAHKQPWTFCVVSNKELKHKIRELAEEEERRNYSTRMSDKWKKDLEHLGTNSVKEFLDIAPYLIVIFRKPYDLEKNGNKSPNYYVNESVGIASGMLIAAIHNAGLVTLTHTPSPMGFLEKVLDRPKNEKAYLLLPVGYPSKSCKVPNLKRKNIKEIAFYYE